MSRTLAKKVFAIRTLLCLRNLGRDETYPNLPDEKMQSLIAMAELAGFEKYYLRGALSAVPSAPE
jgi:hypothetical protein